MRAATMIGVLLLTAGATGAVATADPATTGATSYRSVATGLCLEVLGGSTADGALLGTGACTGAPHQLFRLVGSGPEVAVVAEHTGKCLDGRDGLTVQQSTCTGAASQQWTTEPGAVTVHHGNILFKVKSSRRCATAGAAARPVSQAACAVADRHQNWTP